MVSRPAMWAKCVLVCAHVCLCGRENRRSVIRSQGKIQLAHRMAIRHHKEQTQSTQLIQAHTHALAFAAQVKPTDRQRLVKVACCECRLSEVILRLHFLSNSSRSTEMQHYCSEGFAYSFCGRCGTTSLNLGHVLFLKL